MSFFSRSETAPDTPKDASEWAQLWTQQTGADKQKLVTLWLHNMHATGTDLNLPELMYYRSKLPFFARASRRKPKRSSSGAMLSKTKGRGMEFDEVRHYQAGDDIRAIDWRVTARTGTTHTKLFREEQERPVFVVTDLSPSLMFGTAFVFKAVQAAHLAAVLAWRAQARGDRVGGMVGNGFSHTQLRPMARHQGVMRYLHALIEKYQESYQHWQQQQAPQEDSLTHSLRGLSQLARPGSEIYVISDFQRLNQAQLDAMRTLQQHCQVRPLLINDPFETELPEHAKQGPLMLLGGNGQQRIDLSDPTQRQDYQSQAQAQQLRQQQRLQQQRLRTQSVSSASPIELQWQELML